MEDSTSLVQYETTDDILQDMRGIIEVSREKAIKRSTLRSYEEIGC